MTALSKITPPATTNSVDLPKASNGLTPLLRTLLDSRSLDRHRALVAVELEVLAKKFDRFGWDRDLGTPAHDRLLMDWMDALCDYPLDEVQVACRAAVLDNPSKMPNEGHVKAQILKARAKVVVKSPEPNIQAHKPTDEERQSVSRMLQEAGFAPKRFGGDA